MVADTAYTVPLLIDGKEVTTTTTFTITSPASHKTLWQSSSASKDDVAAAVKAAQTAFPSWSKLKPAAKRTIFLKAADIMEKRASELVGYAQAETGGTMFIEQLDVPNTIEMLRDVAGRVGSVMGHIPTCKDDGTSALVVKEPYGVVLGIAPWFVHRIYRRSRNLPRSGMPHIFLERALFSTH